MKVANTHKSVEIIAKNYGTRNAFKINDNTAYHYAMRHKLLDRVCKHMAISACVRLEVTPDSIREILTYSPDTGTVLYAKSTTTGFIHKGSGYRLVNIAGKSYKEHRLIYLWMTGVWPTGVVDHRDGDTTNNRWCNLRDITHRQNTLNRKINSNSTTGVAGVSFKEGRNVYVARISHEGKRVALGTFATLQEATIARQAAEKLYGYIIRVN